MKTLIRHKKSTLAIALTSMLGVGMMGSGVDVNAGTSTGTLSVSATVSANCVFKGGGSAGTLAFGNYDPVNVNATTPLDVTSSFQVRCTKGTSAFLGMDLGQNASGSARRLSGGAGNYLIYEIYKDSGRSTVWGNSGGDRQAYTPSTSAYTNVNVYGRIPGGQDVSAASYADTVNLTVEF